MADGVTTNLKIATFDAGSRRGTWKTDFDADVLNRIDRAFGSKDTKTVTTGDNTLDDNEIRAAGVVVSGTLVANATLIMPGVQARLQVYVNGCTIGAFTLSVKQEGGSSAELPVGTSLVWFDGTSSAPVVSTFVAEYEGNPNLVLSNSGSITADAVAMVSAGTMDIGAQSSHLVDISANNAISSFSTANAGTIRWLLFSGTPTVNYNATSMILPGSANITAQAGDIAMFRSLGSGNWRCMFWTRRDGTSVATASGSGVSSGSSFTTDNRITRTDGTSGRNIQTSAITVDDSGNMSGIGTIASGAITASGTSGFANITASGTANITGALDAGSATIGNHSFTGVTYEITYVDAGASAGPVINLYRDSASPAASDALGQINWFGEDSAGNQQTYGFIRGVIMDPTSTSEDSRLEVNCYGSGSSRLCLWTIGGSSSSTSGFGVGTAPASGLIDPSAGTTTGSTLNEAGEQTTRSNGDAPWRLCRVDDGVLINFYLQTTNEGSISGAGTTITYGAFAGEHPSRLLSEEVADILPGTILQTEDKLVEWLVGEYEFEGQKGIYGTVPKEVEEGDTFTAKIPVEREVIKRYKAEEEFTDSIGRKRKRMVEKVEEPRLITMNVEVTCTAITKPGDILPYVGVADAWSKRPYGVFQRNDEIDDGYNDLHVIGLGAFYVRMAAGTTPEMGDLIRAGQNGCGMPITEADGLSALTLARVHVATITGTKPLEVYEDGSFTLPATIHCG